MCNKGSRLNVTVQDTFCLLVFDKWMVEKNSFCTVRDVIEIGR